MKKATLSLLIASALIFGAIPDALAAGNTQRSDAVFTIGATPVPHAELLNFIRDDMAAQGFTMRVIEFTDYVQPNMALISGDLDANFFQHIPYLETNAEWRERLVSAFGVHIEPFGLYSSRHRSIADLPNGASIAIPNDPSNGGRALLLLQSNGLITLRPDVGLRATPRDITGNPRNFRFQELEGAQLPRSLGDVDAATINGNFALQAGLSPLRDSLIIEGPESPYVNIVVTQRGRDQTPAMEALRRTLLSQRVKDHILRTWSDGSVVPAF
jgi:D-methionine transport system substrate-binding protein